MDEHHLGRDLRAIDSPATPRPEFVESLFARLLDEGHGRPPAGRPAARMRPRRGGDRPLLLVAALLITGTIAGAVVVGSGALSPDPSARTSPIAAGPATAVASTEPTRTPTAATTSLRPAASTLPIADAPVGLGALTTTGSVVFERRTIGSPTRLRIYAADGASREVAPDVPGMQVAASWSPDGRTLAFAAAPLDDPLPYRIWRTDADGGSPTLLSTDCDPPACIAESEPAYSPDGGRLAFVRTAAGAGDGVGPSVLAIRDLATGTVTELAPTAQPAGRMLLHPSFSPDGSTIAYAVATRGVPFDETGSAIWSVAADGTALRQLTPDAMVAGDPAWSPDGERILFATYPIRTIWAENQRALDISHLYTMAPDGTDVRRLPLPDQVGGATWTAGGRDILYTAIVNAGLLSPGFTWIMTVDADATSLRTVSRGAKCCDWYAIQQPTP